MPPLSRGLIQASKGTGVSRQIIRLDFLLPWTTLDRYSRRLYSDQPEPSSSNIGQDSTGHAISSTDLLEKQGESSKQALDHASSTRSHPSSDTRLASRRVTHLSEEVASLSSSLPSLLQPWDQHPPEGMLPGVTLPKPSPPPEPSQRSIRPSRSTSSPRYRLAKEDRNNSADTNGDPNNRKERAFRTVRGLGRSQVTRRRDRSAGRQRTNPPPINYTPSFDIHFEQLGNNTFESSFSPDEEVKEMTKRLRRSEMQRRRRSMREPGLDAVERIRKLRTSRRRQPLLSLRPIRNDDPASPTYTSFVKRQLVRENPPSPRIILNSLGARPELLTTQNLQVLLRYAERVGDQDTGSQVRRTMALLAVTGRRQNRRARFRRLGSQSFRLVVHVVSRWLRRWNRNKPERPPSAEDAFDHVRKELRRRQEDHQGTEYPDRAPSPFWYLHPHPWAEATTPMCKRLSSSPTIDDRLGYLHYKLATADLREGAFSGRIRPEEAIASGEIAPETNDLKASAPSTDDNVLIGPAPISSALIHRRDVWFSQLEYPSPFLASTCDLVQACQDAGKKQQGTRQIMLLVLHLYMIYANRIKEFCVPPIVPAGCSTVLYSQLSQPYLGVWMFEEYIRLYLYPRPSRQTLHLLLQGVLFGRPTFHPPAESDQSARRNYLYRSPPKPDVDESPRLIKDTHFILRTFQRRWDIHPGPETIRLLSSYALQVDNADLAKECWGMWWADMSRKVAREPRWEGDYPRWDHRKKHSNSWIEILRQMEGRGWVEKGDATGSRSVSPLRNDSAESIAQSLAELHGKADSTRERRVLKRRLARAKGMQEESEIHPDIHKGKDVDGHVWYGFTDRPRRWRWVAGVKAVEITGDQGHSAGQAKRGEVQLEI